MIALSYMLRPDTALISKFRADESYDYARELVPNQTSVWDAIKAAISNFESDFFSGLSTGSSHTFIITIGIIVLVVVAVIIIKRNPNFFFRNKKAIADTADKEDNIYGIDFDLEIDKARRKGDWHNAVRLIYLKTLRFLADEGSIEWRPSKTPTQYTYEVRTDDFRQMTRLFLRVRYGGFPADEAMADTMRSLSQKLMAKGGEA